MYQGLFTIIDWESPLTFEAHPFHRATPSSLATTSVRVTRRVVKVAVPPMRAVRQQVSKGVACSVRWINSGSQAFKKNIKKIEKELATCHFTNWIRSYSCQLWDLWQKKMQSLGFESPKIIDRKIRNHRFGRHLGGQGLDWLHEIFEGYALVRQQRKDIHYMRCPKIQKTNRNMLWIRMIFSRNMLFVKYERLAMLRYSSQCISITPGTLPSKKNTVNLQLIM